MNVFFESEVDLTDIFDFDIYEEIKRTIKETVDYLNCPYETEVNVLFTTNSEIQKLNSENRGIDKPTDVLSFPMIEWDTPCDFNFSEEDEITLCNPDTGELMLGDIVVSVDKAIEQSKEYGHSLKREVLFLIAHSMLHLFGFDHMDDSEREKMENMQREILNNIGITR